MKCSKCNELEYVIDDKKEKHTCLCVKFKSLMSYAPEIMKSTIRLSYEERKQAFAITNKEQNIFMHVDNNIKDDIVNSYILYYLLKHELPYFHILNVYELIEIYFKNHPKFNSIFGLEFDIFIFLEGYHEFPNVRQNDITLQMFDIIKRKNKRVLYINKKYKIDNEIIDYIETNNWWVEKSVIEKSAYETL